MCATNLKCTTSDQICRTAEVFFAAGDASNENGVLTVGRGDGVNFTLQQLGTGQPQALFGTSSTDLWVIAQGPTGNNGQTAWARHWNGSQWGPQINFPDGNTVYAFWGNAPNNYWAANNGGAVLHYDGQTWSAPMPVPGSPGIVQLWGSSGGDLYGIGNGVVHRDPSGTWTTASGAVLATAALRAITGHANGDFLSGGAGPGQTTNPAVVLRHSGANYTVEMLGDGTDCHETFGVWSGDGDEWAITGETIPLNNCDPNPHVFHYINGTWMKIGNLPDAKSAFQLWGSSNKDLFTIGTNAAGTPAVFHYDGTAWTTPYTTTAVGSIRAIWGIGEPQ